ncbi:Pre-mRNA-splicing factor cwf16 [Coemansia javaensis]|uniref:Splicing factor YJU2 n=1 Tax=Coemansia javaensis TaxID=2761396 RepID=A0A9W8LIJ7_9FUNG|nr:Pre-mRNA-splicing factor cwf16 [Coemansia javaensis]
MSERKVLNKYIPPDFDPAKIPRLRLGGNRQVKVRLMAPFSMRCATCGQWIGRGTKFNARKEAVEGEKFHSIQIFRFYIRCQRCAAEITFRTDPENLNYQVEKGAQRNFEPWREEQAINKQLQQEKEEAEEDNPIKALENRTEQSRREMEDMDKIDELRMLNARAERALAYNQLIVPSDDEAAADEERANAEDEELVRRAFATTADGGRRVKRAREEDAVQRERSIKSAALKAPEAGAVPPEQTALARALLGVKKVERKKPEPSPPPATLGGALGAYASSDSDSD